MLTDKQHYKSSNQQQSLSLSMLNNDSIMYYPIINNKNGSNLSLNSTSSNHNNHRSQSPISGISSTAIPVKHYDNLINELRCPGCAKPMTSPIKLCVSGHSICSFCVKNLSGCPLCKGKFTNTRSITLETLSIKAQFYCGNARHGCPVRLPIDLLKWHEERCVYQIGECFMGKVWKNGCNWSGCEIDWLDHCVQEHREYIWNIPEVTLTWIGDEHGKPPLSDQQKPIIGYYMFRVFNETFNVYHLYDQLKAKMIWTIVKTSRNTNRQNRFAYEIELYLPLEPANLLTRRLLCRNENDDNILEDGHCIKINTFDMGLFLDEKKFRVLMYRQVSSTSTNRQNRFAYEIELYLPLEPANLLTRRLLCRNENDDNILEDGHCIKINTFDMGLFLDEKKVLHYRIRIIDLCANELTNQLVPLSAAASAIGMDEKLNYAIAAAVSSSNGNVKINQQTSSSVVPLFKSNFKNIPKENIITKDNPGFRNNTNTMVTDCLTDLRKQYYQENSKNQSITDDLSDLREKYNRQSSTQKLNEDLKEIFKKEFIDNSNANGTSGDKTIASPKINAIPKPPRNSIKQREKSSSIEIALLSNNNETIVSIVDKAETDIESEKK